MTNVNPDSYLYPLSDISSGWTNTAIFQPFSPRGMHALITNILAACQLNVAGLEGPELLAKELAHQGDYLIQFLSDLTCTPLSKYSCSQRPEEIQRQNLEKKVRVMRVMGLSIKVCVCVCAHRHTCKRPCVMDSPL